MRSLVLLIVAAVVAASAPPTVVTDTSGFSGTVCRLRIDRNTYRLSHREPGRQSAGRTIHRYPRATTEMNSRASGIRYAEPPVGTQRWRAAVPHTVDSNVTVDATTYGACCPQPVFPNVPAPAVTNEDCM